MAVAGSLTYDTEIDKSGFKKGLDELENTAKSGGETIKNAFKNIAIGITGAVTSLVALTQMTQDTMEDMGKLEAGFTSVGHSADTAKDVFYDMVGILGETDTAVEASNHLAVLTDSQEELSKWTDIATGVYAKFGDSLPLEGLTEAANETAKTGTVVGQLADALNWAGISEDDFNKKLAMTNSEKERATLITETLYDTYLNSAEAYKDVNGELIEARKAQARFNEVMSELGRVLLPVVTSFLEQVTPLIETFINNLNEKLDNVNWQEFFNTLNNIFTIIIPLTAAFVAYKTAISIDGIITRVKKEMKGMTIAQYALNKAMSLNPITIVIALITALVTAIIYLWNTNEDFRNALINAWNTIKDTAIAVWEWLGELFTKKIPEWILSVIDWFSKLPGEISNWLTQTVNKIINWGNDMKNKAVSAMQNMVNGIVNAVKSLPDKMLNIGKNIVQGIWNGISGAGQWLWNKISGWCSNIVNSIKNFFGIHSPSTLFRDKIGKMLPQGLALGVDADTDKALEAIDKMDNAIVNKMTKSVDVSKNGIATSGITGTVNQILSANARQDIVLYNNLDLDGEKVYSNQQKISAKKNLQYAFA